MSLDFVDFFTIYPLEFVSKFSINHLYFVTAKVLRANN